MPEITDTRGKLRGNRMQKFVANAEYAFSYDCIGVVKRIVFKKGLGTVLFGIEVKGTRVEGHRLTVKSSRNEFPLTTRHRSFRIGDLR